MGVYGLPWTNLLVTGTGTAVLAVLFGTFRYFFDFFGTFNTNKFKQKRISGAMIYT